MEIAEYVEAVRREGELLADAAERAGLDAPVPPCAPWQVKDLLRHTGYIHRWATRHLAERPEHVIDGPGEAEILAGGAPDAELAGWFRAGHAALVRTLGTADPGLACATFMDAPSPLAFWARRQAHETAIHRADACSASGTLPGFAPDFAADGVDELITGFGRRRKYQPRGERGRDGVLHVQAADTGDEWTVQPRDGRPAPYRGAPGQEAACTVTGPASGIYVFLWNRCGSGSAGVTVTGDGDVLARWKSAVRVRWG
jgi:uncharacterized protein (TIGR03083 family)